MIDIGGKVSVLGNGKRVEEEKIIQRVSINGENSYLQIEWELRELRTESKRVNF